MNSKAKLEEKIRIAELERTGWPTVTCERIKARNRDNLRYWRSRLENIAHYEAKAAERAASQASRKERIRQGKLRRFLQLLNRAERKIRWEYRLANRLTTEQRRAKIKAKALEYYHLHDRGRPRREKMERGAFFRACQKIKKCFATRQSHLEKTFRRTVEATARRKLVKALRRRLEGYISRLKTRPESVSAAAQKLVGCSISELRYHLERQFLPGMTWENHGYDGWHIDHVRPIARYNLNDPAQVAECFHYTNLQPLWAKDNLLKGANL